MLGVKWKIDLKKEEICYTAHTSDFCSETKLCFFLNVMRITLHPTTSRLLFRDD